MLFRARFPCKAAFCLAMMAFFHPGQAAVGWENYVSDDGFELVDRLGESDRASNGVLSFVSPDPASFVATADTMIFRFDGAYLDDSPGSVHIYEEDGSSVPQERIQVTPHGIIVDNAVRRGKTISSCWLGIRKGEP